MIKVNQKTLQQQLDLVYRTLVPLSLSRISSFEIVIISVLDHSVLLLVLFRFVGAIVSFGSR